jgi:hypothetical protein
MVQAKECRFGKYQPWDHQGHESEGTVLEIGVKGVISAWVGEQGEKIIPFAVSQNYLGTF